jgi:dynactin complex subunit
VLRNQRLEIMSDIRKEYVSVETFRADHAVLAAENAQLKSDLTSVNAKLDRIQITLVRLTDSVKLKEEQ